MDIVKVRKEHNCIECNKKIKVHEEVLRIYVDLGGRPGRHYYCNKHVRIELQKLLTQLEKEEM